MYKKLVSIFKKFSIRRKIGVVYALCIIPVLLVLSITVILILRNAVATNIEISVNNNSQIIISQIEDKMQSAENCANIMLGYLNELEFLRKESEKKISSLKKHNEVLKKMTYAYRVFSDIDGMVFIDREKNIYGDNVQIEAFCSSNYPEHMVEDMNKIGGRAMWFDMSQENSIPKEEGSTTLTLGKNIVDIFTGERLGVLFIIIKESSISRVYEELRLSHNAYYVVANQSGKVISSPKKDEIGGDYLIKSGVSKDGKPIRYFDKRQYLFTMQFDKIPYYLVFHAPIKELMKEMVNIIIYIIIIGGFSILCAWYLASKLAGRIAKPIVKLSQAMGEVANGDMSVRCEIDTLDETKLIGDGFNNMLNTIQQLIRNVEKEQKSKRKFEMALIQSQIKPHFLYNTLDTVYVLCHLGRSDDAKRTVKALADFYRVSLSAGREIINVEAEIKCTQDYLKIQKIRYEDEFDYDIDIDKKYYQYSILKLTIQPLVENAIYHGLKEKEGNGHLRIYAKEESDSIFIYVEDNGCGMDEERRKKLLLEDTKASFGIKNLHDRIQTYFGQAYGITVESILGEGTSVKIHIPKKEE